MAVDFGEQDNTSVVLVVEVSPSTPARITEVPVTAGRRLRTVRGTVAELVGRAAEFGEDFLRVYVREPSRAGLREEVQDALPNALEIRIDPEFVSAARSAASSSVGGDRSPGELFAAFCAEQVVADDRVGALFARLHDEETSV